MTVQQRHVFITGASSGIGEALARAYAARGATLGLVARRRERLLGMLDDMPGQHSIYPVDVCDAAALSAAAADFMAHHGVPEVVIACAGVSVGTLTEEAEDLVAFEQVLRTNVLGTVASFQAFVAPMRSRGSGALVGISSVAGVRGLPGAGAYSASKAAVSRYLESLRVEMHGSGVRVIEIRPGYVATPMTAINPYRMPFLLHADEAARRFIRVIESGRARATVPWQMAIVAQLLAHLPCALFDRLFAKAGRKPRGLLNS